MSEPDGVRGAEPQIAAGPELAALPGEVWHDGMSYCPFQWLSSYTYPGRTPPAVVVVRSEFAGAAPIQVRAVATDGFPSSIVARETLPVEDLPS